MAPSRILWRSLRPVDTHSGIFETVIFLHESSFRLDETRNVFQCKHLDIFFFLRTYEFVPCEQSPHFRGVNGVLLFARQLTRSSAKLRPRTRKTVFVFTSISVPLNTPKCTTSMSYFPFIYFGLRNERTKKTYQTFFIPDS